MRILAVAFVVAGFLALAFSCANQTSPTGGPKDSIPPTFIRSTPPNKTVNLNTKTIELEFDEHIAINNPREQLLISPSVGKDVEMTARKRTVVLKINSDLQDSTTYTINFRESIQDITEKNPAENLQLVYSTGSYLDSLTIEGRVFELLTGRPAKDATVAIYNNADTFNIFDHKPNYLTKTDEEGFFSLQNLKAGRYYVYGFNDNNKNIIVDSKTEAYGFIAEAMDLAPADSGRFNVIPLLSLDARPIKLIGARPYNTYFNVRVSKNLKDFTITPEVPADTAALYYRYGDDRANIKIYAPELTQDSIAIRFQAVDSISFAVDTVLHVKRSPRDVTPERFTVAIDKPTVLYTQGILQANITFSKPIATINEDSLVYQIDSLTSVNITTDQFTWEPKTGKGELRLPIDRSMFKQENTGNQLAGPSVAKSLINKLIFGKGAFISIENDSSAHMEQTPTVMTPETTGVILVETNTQAENYITQLITPDYKVVRYTINQPASTFNNLPPGSYQVRLIIDANANGQWDPGNYYNREEPEPAAFYRNEEGELTVNIKANWELGPLLITWPQPVDKRRSIPRRKKQPR